jgi:nitrate reductase alpha subunit
LRSLAKKFSELCPGHLDKEKDVVASPILHDTPGEMAQATDVKAWFNDYQNIDKSLTF